jgi:hypothetical protein
VIGEAADPGYVIGRPTTVSAVVDGLQIDTLYHLRPDSTRIAFLGQSALTAENKLVGLPFFFRHSWVEDINVSTVIFNDPTLYLYSDLLCGWSQGRPDLFGIEAMAEVCSSFTSSVGDAVEFGFYGSSAGGFWALFMAAYFGARCVVETPQTDMFSYPLDDPREQLFDRCFRDHGLRPEDYRHRLNAADWFEHLGRSPSRIQYFQSRRDAGHIASQMEPFVERAQSAGWDLRCEMYDREASKPAHGPMEKRRSLEAIHSLFEER